MGGTGTLPMQPEQETPALQVCSVAALPADAIDRLHRNEPMDLLLMRD
jgi:hypothetical protein